MNYEDEIAAQPRGITRPDLATWAVGELKAYIQELTDEIARATATIDRKQQHRSAADTFFREPKS